MEQEVLKIELTEWLAKLNNKETIEFLKVVKDSQLSSDDWWSDLSSDQKAGIERGLKDIRQGKTMAFEDVKKKYGL